MRGVPGGVPISQLSPIDHVVPQSKGGTDHMDNLQLLCGACNSMKGTGTQAELIVKLQAQESKRQRAY